MSAPWHWEQPWFVISGLACGLLIAGVVIALSLWMEGS